ncbi:MAG: hypothetical protein JWP77_2680 [Polaromonas sp.]|nr:hypothetical protein [Polaromonas sp.]
MLTSDTVISYLKNSWKGMFAALLLVIGISNPAIAQTCATSVNWAQTNSYAAGSIVKYTDGNLYFAKVAAGPGIRPTISTYYWALKSLCAGPVSAPAPVMCNYPDWVQFKQYQTGDIVKYKDGFYKAAYANPGYIPTVSTFFWKSFSCSAATTSAVKFHGRFDYTNPAAPRYSWSGSSMSAQFSGTSISVTLNESDARVYYAYVIDDQPVRRFTVSVGTNAYSLATGLGNGTHKVLLMRESEGAQAGPSQFMGFSFGETGQLVSPPEYPNKYRLEFVGDSITAGFGNLGTMPCGFSTVTESAYWSYAQQTAVQLGEAPATNISISGIGVYLNYGNAGPSVSGPSMPFYYSQDLIGEANSAGSNSIAPGMQPTVVVVNLGNNDFWDGAPNQTDFVSAYVDLFKTIRSRYPSAMLIAATHAWSNQQGYVQAAYNQILNSGETKVRYAEFPIRDWNGCSGHPTKAADLEVANYLAQFIRNLGI